MLERIPALIAAICLSIYWAWVVVKLFQLGIKLGKDPNAMPRERVGQAMRLLWYPCIGVMLAGLWLTALLSPERLERMWGRGMGQIFGWLLVPGTAWWTAAIPATLICVVSMIMTFVCWHKMGRSWRIGIDPNEKLALVSTGPYRYVRHPIYALRMVINVCAFVMSPTLLVLIAVGIDIILLQVEARREERYMELKHGAEYERYKNSVGRFVPRAFVV